MDWSEKPETISGSAAWHEWRSNGFGASDAAVVMDESPWKGPHRLWLEKTGQKLPEAAGFAAQRGTKLEPIARAKAEKELERLFPDKTFEKGFIRASLDGWNEETQEGIEIKCTGLATHELVKATNEPPIHYMWQIQQQYLCSNADVIYYCSYYVGKDVDENDGELFYFPVKRDDEMLAQYIEQAKKFWDCVLFLSV